MWRKRFSAAHPVSRAEIHGLCKVVALVEAAVVGSGEGHHELSRTLIGPVNLEGREYCRHEWQEFVSESLKDKGGAYKVYVRGRRAPLGHWDSLL